MAAVERRLGRRPRYGALDKACDCPGARLRYQLDRDSAEYKTVYQQRTADERTLAPALRRSCKCRRQQPGFGTRH